LSSQLECCSARSTTLMSVATTPTLSSWHFLPAPPLSKSTSSDLRKSLAPSILSIYLSISPCPSTTCIFIYLFIYLLYIYFMYRCVYVYRYVCITVYVYRCVCVAMCVSLCVCRCMCVCRCVHVNLYRKLLAEGFNDDGGIFNWTVDLNDFPDFPNKNNTYAGIVLLRQKNLETLVSCFDVLLSLSLSLSLFSLSLSLSLSLTLFRYILLFVIVFAIVIIATRSALFFLLLFLGSPKREKRAKFHLFSLLFSALLFSALLSYDR